MGSPTGVVPLLKASKQELSPFYPDMLREKLHIRSSDEMMAALLGVVFPLKGIVLEMGPIRGTRGSRVCVAVAAGAPFTCKECHMSSLIFSCGFRDACSYILACRFSLESSRLAQMLLADLIVPPFGVLYVVWCFRHVLPNNPFSI
jgi:hypothetical protein